MDEKQLIDDLEKESMLELEVMHESENTDNERIIEDAKSKIEKLFDDVRWKRILTGYSWIGC